MYHKLQKSTQSKMMIEQQMQMRMSSIPPVKSQSALSEMSADATVVTEASDASSDMLRVSFGEIQVREFERIVGDHPETRIGVPLTIGWAFHEKQPVSIERYEADRLPKGNLRMSSITRKNILHNVFGIPEEELRAAEKEVQKIKKGRNHSLKQSKIGAKTESGMKSIRRKVRKALNAEAFIKGLSVAASTISSTGMMMSVMSPQ
jgi:hypothetical protein